MLLKFGLIFMGAAFGFVIYRLVSLAMASRTMPPPPGLSAGGTLPRCESAMRCVNSDETGDAHIDPLQIPGKPDEVRQRLTAAIGKVGGQVRVMQSDYVHALFRTPLLGFIDDVEFRIDGNRVAVKSASRVGKSDLGANRKRVEALRAALETR